MFCYSTHLVENVVRVFFLFSFLFVLVGREGRGGVIWVCILHSPHAPGAEVAEDLWRWGVSDLLCLTVFNTTKPTRMSLWWGSSSWIQRNDREIMQKQPITRACFIFKGVKHNFNRQNVGWGGMQVMSMKVMYLFIYLSIFLKKAIWFLPSLSFLKRWCVFLPSMRTVQLFCVLFSPCVYSRPSTVTYLIFVTVTKVITYSIDVYIQHIIWKQCERRDSLCCTSLSLDRLFYGFFFLCCFDSCIGIQGCKLDVKKQMWQVNVIYSNKFQEIVTAVTFWIFFF